MKGNLMRINYKQLGQSIKSYRLKRNLTQEKLAEMCNLSTPHISNIERGTESISFSTLEKLLENLQINFDFIVYEKSNSSNLQCNNCKHKNFNIHLLSDLKHFNINSDYKS